MVNLESYRWNNRIVLVFGTAATDVAVMQQRAWLDQQARGIDARHVVVGYIFEHGPSVVGEEAMSPEDAATLREQFDIRSGTFNFVLVGKDGGVKRSANEPVAADDLFALIDAMPIRQREMRQQGENR